jgi:hypothetical protein
MIEAMMVAVQSPVTHWAVLCLGGLAIVVEAVRASPKALWEDFFAED